MFALRAAGLIGTAAVLVGCSSGSGSPPSSSSSSSPTAASPAPTPSADVARQQYLDAVNDLCDDLLPKVIKATHGGSIDITATQYLRDWPAHKKLLDAFDDAWGTLAVPPSAVDAAKAMSRYVEYATGLDQLRLLAAHDGEKQWRAEVRKEEAAPLDPSITARNSAGFHQSCDAR